MRFAMLAAVVLTAAVALPVVAAKSEPTTVPATEARSAPDWHDCYDLAWIRGVHTEQNELPAWMEECMSGNVPFGEDFVRFYKRQEKKHQS
jgi:hypothetical protein